MKQIPLTQGKIALVDDEDFEWLSKLKWSVRKTRKNFYAQRNISKTKIGDMVAMHRQIMMLKKGDGIHVDHINGNGLDNRRCNLRECTNQQNHFNTRTTTGSSKYKGVCRVTRPQRKKWLAQIMLNAKHHFIGYFNDEVMAAKAYDKKAIELFGKYAYLNFPKEVANAS